MSAVITMEENKNTSRKYSAWKRKDAQMLEDRSSDAIFQSLLAMFVSRR